MQRIIVTTMFIVLGITGPLLAQQTTGNINGRLVDAQGSAVPGVTVTAKNTQTGLTRTETSDAEGVYRLTALPVGVYDITAELQGFSKVDNKGIVVNVGQTIDVNMLDLESRHSIVGAARSLGLFGIVELVKDRKSMEPLAPFNGTSEPMLALGRFLRQEGLYTFVRWNTIMPRMQWGRSCQLAWTRSTSCRALERAFRRRACRRGLDARSIWR